VGEHGGKEGKRRGTDQRQQPPLRPKLQYRTEGGQGGGRKRQGEREKIKKRKEGGVEEYYAQKEVNRRREDKEERGRKGRKDRRRTHLRTILSMLLFFSNGDGKR
jgi:hypothetical protein